MSVRYKALAACLLVAVSAFAKEVEDTLSLNQVVVTGTLTPRTLKDTPVVTRLITRGDIARSDAADITDLLATELPGLEFTMSMNQQTALNLGGFTGQGVLFLVDGQRLAGETLDNIDYSRLNLSDLGRIEIVRGAASAIYGSGAAGGVVNLISRPSLGDPGPIVRADARLGTHMQQRYSLTAGWRQRRWTASVSTQFLGTGAIRLTSKEHEAGDLSTIYAHHSWHVSPKATYEPFDGLRLSAKAGYFFRQRDVAPQERERYRAADAAVTADWRVTDRLSAQATYAYDQYDKSDYTPSTGLDVRDYSNVRNTANLRLQALLPHDVTVVGGAEYMRDYLMSYQFEARGSYRQHTVGAFAQSEWIPVEQLSVVAGLRYDYYSRGPLHRLTPRVNAMWRPLRQLTLRASWGQGLRAPSLKERFMVFDMAGIFMIYGNPALKPERSNNYQLSLQWTPRRQYDFSLTAYCSRIDDRITTLWNQALGGQVYANQPRVRLASVEANVAATCPQTGLTLRLTYAFTHETSRHGASAMTTTRPHSGTMRLTWDGSPWRGHATQAALYGRWLSAVSAAEYTSVDQTATQRAHYPGYTLWRLTASQDLFWGLRATLTIDNIFGYRPSRYTYNSPVTTGTAVIAGLSLAL